MRHRTPHLANPVRLPPPAEPEQAAAPRMRAAVVTPISTGPSRDDWRLAALALALTLIAVVAVSL